MRIDVIILPKARAELLALLEANTHYPTDALLTAQIFIEDIRTQLLKTGNPPAGSRVVEVEEKGFWWLYIDGIWIGIRLEERPAGFLRAAKRTLTLNSAVSSLSLV